MTLWAIVPVKPLRVGKSRLANALSVEERARLSQFMLERTLDTLGAASGFERVLVVSRDPEALALAREHGAHTVTEDGAPQLNLALGRATMVAQKYAVRGVLILPADLPHLRVADIAALQSKAAAPPVVVIVPDRRGEGTNALLVSPPGLIRYDFGSGSFQRHCRLAEQAGAHLEVLELPSVGLDIDIPEDLGLIRHELDQLGIPLKPEIHHIGEEYG